jgi:hypothetical protein
MVKAQGGVISFASEHLPAAFTEEAKLLDEAVDTKVEQQQRFVDWWDETVRRKGGRALD